MSAAEHFPVLEFLKKYIIDPGVENTTHMRYPTAISKTLRFSIVDVDRQKAVVTVQADPQIHGNQQGTVHGGLLCELADAAIGTAHSTVMQSDQSFTTVELKMNFIRPTWTARLRAEAECLYGGRTLSHYQCRILNEEGKLVATAVSTVMTLNGEKAKGR